MEDDMYDDEINTTCSTLLCVERVEQILMGMGYTYNYKYKLFEKYISEIDKDNKESSYLKTICIDQKNNKAYYLLIDKRLDIETVSKDNKPSQILINYLGHIPDTELDFLILCNLLSLKNFSNEDIDKDYFNNIINKFKTLLLSSGYDYSKTSGKFFKQIITYTNVPIYLSIYIDTNTDLLQIAEEYSHYSLLTGLITTNQNKEMLPIYSGKIPKTKFEFHTISNLIDLYLE